MTHSLLLTGGRVIKHALFALYLWSADANSCAAPVGRPGTCTVQSLGGTLQVFACHVVFDIGTLGHHHGMYFQWVTTMGCGLLCSKIFIKFTFTSHSLREIWHIELKVCNNCIKITGTKFT